MIEKVLKLLSTQSPTHIESICCTTIM